MPSPYSRNFVQEAVPSGAALQIELAAPRSGILTRLVVIQTSGTAAGFSFDLYDADVNELTDGSTAAGHKIGETRTATAPSTESAEYEIVLPYENKELLDSTSKRNKSRIFLHLTPDGTGDKDFEIAYTITTD